jgi:hypothetical protein
MIWRVCHLDAKVSYKSQLTTVNHQSLNTVNQVLAFFLERKTKASTLEGFKLALRRQTISPALDKIHKKSFFNIRVAQWIRVPGYQNGYPGSGIYSGTRVPVPSTSDNGWLTAGSSV